MFDQVFDSLGKIEWSFYNFTIPLNFVSVRGNNSASNGLQKSVALQQKSRDTQMIKKVHCGYYKEGRIGMDNVD